jgi:hypothetical protein
MEYSMKKSNLHFTRNFSWNFCWNRGESGAPGGNSRRAPRIGSVRGVGAALALALALAVPAVRCAPASAAAQAASQATRILMPEDLTRIMPEAVFFRGQTATVQMRNAFGLRLPNDAMVLFGLVDSSGYSSGLRQKYQGYLLTEVPLQIAGKRLPTGAYGFGFINGNIFVVMDLGGHDVLRVPWQQDETLRRPRPLLLVADGSAGDYRLYEGRRFVVVHPEGKL